MIDDLSVESHDLLYRHTPTVPCTNWVLQDEGDGSFQVQSGALIWSDDGLSTYLHSALELNALTWKCVKRAEVNGVIQLSVGDVRDGSFGMKRDPNPDYIPVEELHPRDVAHTLVVEPEDLSSKQRRKRTRALARLAVLIDSGGTS